MTNDMNYFEMGTPDPKVSTAFYGALFGWDVGEPSTPARYSMIDKNRGGPLGHVAHGRAERVH